MENTLRCLALMLLGSEERKRGIYIRNLIARSAVRVLWVAQDNQSPASWLLYAGPSCKTSAQPLLLYSFHPRLSPSDSPTLLPFGLFCPDLYNLYIKPVRVYTLIYRECMRLQQTRAQALLPYLLSQNLQLLSYIYICIDRFYNGFLFPCMKIKSILLDPSSRVQIILIENST